MFQNFYYCEQFPGLGWSQPINALSSLAFVAVALVLIKKMPNHVHIQRLSLGLMFIGGTSFLWHSTLFSWALWLDTFAIVVFMALFFECYRDLVSFLRAFSLIGFSFLSGILLEPLLPMMTGAFIVPFLCMVFLRLPYAVFFLMAAMVFRILDLPTCGTSMVGTHWLWHVFAAFSLYQPILYRTKRE